MSAVATVAACMERLEADPGENREDLARRMFYLQMEIYSAHAGIDLYAPGDFENLTSGDRDGWLAQADRKLA